MKKSKSYYTISLFSGGMGLDLGLERAGLTIISAIEKDKNCCETIRLNRPGVHLIEDNVRNISPAGMLKDLGVKDIFLLAGGPPCQSFSTAGKRAGLNDPRGNLILEYFRFIKEIRPKYFVFENVSNIITAALKHRPIDKRPGKKWNLSSYSKSEKNIKIEDNDPLKEDELSGSAFRYLLSEIVKLNYSIKFGIVNSADFGSSQKRTRLAMIGSRDSLAPDLPSPTHGESGNGLTPYITIKDTIYDLLKNPGEHSTYGEKMASFFKKIPPGGNWRALSVEEQKEALGVSYYSGGGKTGFMRRLSWDELCPTLTIRPNRKGTSLCHPEETRPLSVKEYSRIQGFPDDWVFAGSMSSKYQQIGNAVPVNLGQILGETILNHDIMEPCQGNAFIPTSIDELLHMHEEAILKLRTYACNKRAKPKKQIQLNLV